MRMPITFGRRNTGLREAIFRLRTHGTATRNHYSFTLEYSTWALVHRETTSKFWWGWQNLCQSQAKEMEIMDSSRDSLFPWLELQDIYVFLPYPPAAGIHLHLEAVAAIADYSHEVLQIQALR